MSLTSDVVYLEHLTGGRYVEEEEEAFTYRRSFDRLSELALDEAEVTGDARCCPRFVGSSDVCQS